MKKILELTVADFKLIFRDPSLRVFLVLPAILFVLVVWLLPNLVKQYEFLIPYVPVFLVLCVIENTQMFCFISGMVLIDEKETEVAKVYGIIPLDRFQYFMSRFLFPYLFTVLLNVILFIVQPFYSVDFASNLVLSLIAALIVPLYALSLNVIAENRMKGLVYIKALNIVVLIPIAAFFVPENYNHLFGVIPTHWIFQAVNNALCGVPFGICLSIGLFFMSLLLWLAGKLFLKKHFV